MKRVVSPKTLGTRFVSGGSASAGKHAEAHAKMWERLSIFGVFPVIVITSYITYVNEQAHHAPPPEYKPYEHMRIRKKNFPWGDGVRSFFHNPERNPLPGIGYEKEFEPKH